jgi:hypothetical protein
LSLLFVSYQLCYLLVIHTRILLTLGCLNR